MSRQFREEFSVRRTPPHERSLEVALVQLAAEMTVGQLRRARDACDYLGDDDAVRQIQALIDGRDR
jgi:hypothetical protein